jgi:uncharacterized membrane protein YhhN
MTSALPTALCALAVGALLASERSDSRPGIWLAKPAAAACFLWAALAWGALDSPYGRWILGGLALSACGDVLLIPRSSGAFRAGIAAFLLGHVAYAVAFASSPWEPPVLALAASGVALAAWRIQRWLLPHVPGDFRLPVIAYLAVISTMVALAVAVSAAGGPLLVAIGAIAFAASDISVARHRFVAEDFANSAWGLPLYFASQLALASTVVPAPGF